MTGPVLLQGGAEMRPACIGMDLELISLAPAGDLVVVLGAATPGGDHDRSAQRALTYYRKLVDDRTVTVAPHPQVDLDGCETVVRAAAVVVLPGGSPSRLLAGLHGDGSRLAHLLLQLHRDGAALSGASAGAMVLHERLVRPDAPGGADVVDGLGLVPGLAMVHDSGGDRDWRDPRDPDGPRWGLPEAGGVLIHDEMIRAVGRGRPRLVSHGRDITLDRLPVPWRDLL